MFYSYEDRKGAADAFIKSRQAAAALYPDIKAIILQFDNKVYNRRLPAALNEKIDRHIYSRITGDHIEIYLYFHNESLTLLNVPLKSLKDGKRIDAAVFIDSLTEYRNKRLQEAAHMTQIMPTIETRYKQIEYIEKLISGITSDLTYREKDIFGLYLRLEKR